MLDPAHCVVAFGDPIPQSCTTAPSCQSAACPVRNCAAEVPYCGSDGRCALGSAADAGADAHDQ
jgi:hypothetical protein